MSENKITFPAKLASNNPKSFGIADATEISGHKSVDTLSDLYSISDSVLSVLKDGSNAIGQEWFVVSEDCKYRLDNWGNRNSVAGWNKLPKQELINTKQSVSEKDQPGGYAGLDSNGKIPIEKTYGTTATVVDVATYKSLPVTGLSGVIYYVSNTSAQYKWSGSAYIDITNGADNAKKNETSIFDCSNGTSTKYYSSLSDAINVVPPAYRTSNRIISYLSTENSTTSAVNYQYHGINSTTWTDLAKWEHIPNQADLAEIRSELNEIDLKISDIKIFENNVDFTNLEYDDYYIDVTSGVWQVSSTCKHNVIPLNGISLIEIKTTPTSVSRIAILKEYNGGSNSYELAGGFSLSDMTVKVGTKTIDLSNYTDAKYLYITRLEYGFDRTPDHVTLYTNGQLEKKVNQINVLVSDLESQDLNERILNLEEKNEIFEGYIFQLPYSSHVSGSRIYDNVNIKTIDLSQYIGIEIGFSANSVTSDIGSLAESGYQLHIKDAGGTLLKNLKLSKDGGDLKYTIPSNAANAVLYLIITNGTAGVAGANYYFSGIKVYRTNTIAARVSACEVKLTNMTFKWNGKKMLAIGDSVTALSGAWQNTVKDFLGLSTVDTRAVGGISIIQMIDGTTSEPAPPGSNPTVATGGILYSLTPDMLQDYDLIILHGCYNEIGKVVWGNVGTIDDMYPINDTVFGRLNYAIKRICTCLKDIGNNKCRVLFSSAHSYGNNPYRNDITYQIKDTHANSIKKACEKACIGYIDCFHGCQINNYNMGYYSSSETVGNVRYISSDSINDGTNKPFSDYSYLPTGVNEGSYATVGTISSFSVYKYVNGVWTAVSDYPYPWNGDRLHPNLLGSNRIGEYLAAQLNTIY